MLVGKSADGESPVGPMTIQEVDVTSVARASADECAERECLCFLVLVQEVGPTISLGRWAEWDSSTADDEGVG